MRAVPNRAERSEGRSFPQELLIPVATARVPSPGTRTLTPSKMVIRRHTVPLPDAVLKNSAFGLMTDPGNSLVRNRRNDKLCNQHNTLVNSKAKYSGLHPGIHVAPPPRPSQPLSSCRGTWMPGTSPGMTTGDGRRVDRDGRRSRRRTHQPTACQSFGVIPLRIARPERPGRAATPPCRTRPSPAFRRRAASGRCPSSACARNGRRCWENRQARSRTASPAGSTRRNAHRAR